MTKYHKDRAFTDFVHKHLAHPLIYNKLDWTEVRLKKDYAKYIDMTDAIDYIFRKDDAIMTVQERFRDCNYKDFTDFTIRYRRDTNRKKGRKESEYYKMKVHYFTYGIVNSSKESVGKQSQFIKYAIIDMKKVYAKLDSNSILLLDNGENTCKIIDNNRLMCPIKYNTDGSSSFFPIDIRYLVKLWGEDLIIAQQGFL